MKLDIEIQMRIADEKIRAIKAQQHAAQAEESFWRHRKESGKKLAQLRAEALEAQIRRDEEHAEALKSVAAASLKNLRKLSEIK